MAFSFGSLGGAAGAGASAAGGSGVQMSQGSDLELIQTEGVGFLSVAGDTKLQLVSKWSEPPLPTASLISVASHKGLVAAAGPDAVRIATTDSVRKALSAEGSGDSDGDIRPFTPQVTIPMQLRVSQLAFTADESFLVLSAETGGGLAVYDVQALAQGSTTQSAFELSTSGETVRSLVPNPMADRAELCALVTVKGNLLMADLKQRSLRSGLAGQPVLRSQVSCVAWSSKGKQLVAGCADGSVYQMTPDGQEKAHIPKPPKLGDYYAASISWLENDVFLVIHNPTAGGQPSEYHIITRNTKAGAGHELVYQKLNDPVEPFGDKAPHHSILRLRDFPPNLQDLLLVASTAVENIGLLTRSKAPLASNVAADKITNVFTTTELADDSRRAQLPMSADYNDTFPVGVALDLSSKDKVHKPIPTDEIEESPGPLPSLWVLNNEGVLVTWWVVYNDSIRQGTTFPGLVAVEDGAAAAPASAFSAPKPATPFGSAALTQTTTPAPAPAFGTSVGLGASSSPWGQAKAASASTSSPARAPAFGAPSTIGSGTAFGASGGLGTKASVWGSSAKTPASPAFGQSAFGSSSATPTAPSGGGFSAFANKTASPFTSIAASSGGAANSSPFSSFKSTGQSGFASLASGTSGGGSVFGSRSETKPFGSTTSFGAPAGASSTTAFPPPATKATGSSVFGSSPFVLGTTFKADPVTANANETTPAKAGSLFGSGFGLSLTQASSTPVTAENTKDEDMDVAAPPAAAEASSPAKPAPSYFESTTPTTTPAPNRFFSPPASTSTPSTTLFGNAAGTTPKAGLFSRPGGLFGTPGGAKADDSTAADAADNEATPKAKQPQEQSLPLPPDGTSKAAFTVGDTSSSSDTSNKAAEDDAPLPPDPFSKPKKAAAEARQAPGLFGKPGAEPPLPPDPFAKPKKSDSEAAAEATSLPEEAPLPPDSLFRTSKSSGAAKADAVPATPLANPFSSMKAPVKSSGSSIFSSNPPPSNDSSLRNPFANLPKPPLSPTTDGSEEEEQSEEGEAEEQSAAGEEEKVEDDDEVEDDEGSGTDIGKDVSPRMNELVKTPSQATHGSFTSTGRDTSANSTFSHIDMPRSQIFGDREAPALRPPRAQEVSPRSPSPQRPTAKPQSGLPTGRLFRDDPQRSFSAPGTASQLLRDTSRQTGGGQASQGFAGSGMFGSRRVARDPNLEEQRKADAHRAAESAKALTPEDSYEAMDRELEQALEPTLQLAECVYILDSDIGGGDSVAAQTEAVYRDINRMVLVLRVNSRNIDAFLRGNSIGGHKTEEDLDEPEGWVLCDVDDLGTIVSRELPTKLRQSRVKGEEALQAAAEALLKEAGQLRVMHEDLARVVQLQVSQDQAAAARTLPLTAEQDVQQNELRRAFTKLMGQLVEAEQQLVMLRTRMSSLAANGGGVGEGGGGVVPALPTVDAVMRTIAKMTAMAEKRSGDIDVLEAQMRKLGLNGRNGRTNGQSNSHVHAHSPFSTPQKQSKRGSGIFSTPGSTQRALFASPGAGGTPTRRKLSGYTDKEKEALRQTRASRQRTLERLQRIHEAEGPRHIGID
ncbi:nuclear pore complex subunit [Grosmannia clavigera kw1407]|uniref:Nuclear pore complex subunit n=1 Tax=Grosmannia clavigera (strain kw1407 / UAMH 11150) TaxID=655863 RepID=F0X9F0_GROCL|nr:nuclear pore complex subunit [Grosmannia clavigera kw1407]EFX05490.1 nuclear pore complex subunit [Grosmannia clavigera kw1407]